MPATVIISEGAQQRGVFEPAYLRLLHSGELAERARLSRQHLEHCDLCARYCGVNRRQSIRGAICRTGECAVVYSAGPHHGEEDCLRGRRGSGTIFFSWCNLRCIYCQNWEIAWRGEGQEACDEELAKMMLDRPITRAEFSEALALASRHGLHLLGPDSFRYEHP